LGPHGWFAPPQTWPWQEPFTHEALQHSTLFVHVLPALRQHSAFAMLQVSPLQHVSGALHDWPALLHVPPSHTPFAPHVRPEQHGWFALHCWPALLHVALWHVSVAALQVKPAQHGWPMAHDCPLPLHALAWHAPFKQVPEQHSADTWQLEPTLRQHAPALHESPAQQPAPHGWPAVLHEVQRPFVHEPEQHWVIAEHVLFVGEQHPPFTHDCPIGHAAHAAPPLPHVMLPCCGGGTHEPPWQQPWQLIASHTHCPLEQRWPAAHAPPVPQRHAPPEQLSAEMGEHAAHAAPPVPHWLDVGGVTQPIGPQHPPPQLVASHTHWPLTQCSPLPQTGPAPQRQPPMAQLSAVMPHVAHIAPPVPHEPTPGF